MAAKLPRPVVISGPSGAGKSTLLKLLMDDFKEVFGISVSHTTRDPRPGEINGKHYNFVTRQEMEEAIRNNEFIETAEYAKHLYGTSIQAVKAVTEAGKICILDIDSEGVKSIKKTTLNPRYVFIEPPNLEVLEERLKGRGTETEDSIQQRLEIAEREMEYSKTPGEYDCIIVNDNLEEAYADLKEFLADDAPDILEKSS